MAPETERAAHFEARGIRRDPTRGDPCRSRACDRSRTLAPRFGIAVRRRQRDGGRGAFAARQARQTAAAAGPAGRAPHLCPMHRALLTAALLFLAAEARAQMLIEDFSDGPAPGWRVVTDRVMGGVSSGQAQVTGGALHLTGTVSTANNGGFVQARLDLAAPLPSGATALHIRVRGDGQAYFIHLRTTDTRAPWHYYLARFDTGPDWTGIALPFAAFRPSGRGLPPVPAAERITSVALVAYGRDHEADVRLARIEAR